MPNYLHSPEFKTYIVEFVRSLSKGERHAFRFWCIDRIPRAKLDIDVADGPGDGDIYRWIECLQDDDRGVATCTHGRTCVLKKSKNAAKRKKSDY